MASNETYIIISNGTEIWRGHNFKTAVKHLHYYEWAGSEVLLTKVIADAKEI